jgi:putative iron-dependent peroxidase
MAGANIMNTIQAGILKPLPSLARYLVFSLNQNASPAESLQALATAFVRDQGEGMDGSSFVAAQQWLHDLDFFESLPPEAQDHVFGRRRSDNEEIDDAPLSAHVKRTAQEDFEPEAFVLRRSMPWADARREGFFFVAFGHSLYAYEAQLKRMAGLDDGILDAIFTYSIPVTGAYFWCPPVVSGQLDLRAVSL